MKMSPNFNPLWSSLIVEELVRNGANHFCLASGSRSTPLIMAVARHLQAKKTLHFDERGASFHALGYGRATGLPAVVVTTSGTALANAWPAVVEASLDHVPLIILSADRPPELRDSGANQTIDPVKFFGDYVRWQTDIPPADEKILPEFLLTTIDQAFYRTQSSPRGPVHLNIMFREPLITERPKKEPRSYLSNIASWRESRKPFTSYKPPFRTLAQEELKELASILNSTEQGLILAGTLSNERDRKTVNELAESLQWPLLPDITSGLRLGNTNSCRIPYYDAILSSKDFLLHPKVVLHVGGRVISKSLLRYLEQQHLSHYILINNHPYRQDPIHRLTMRIETDLSDLISSLKSYISPKPHPSRWSMEWKKRVEPIERLLEKNLLRSGKISEPGAARSISKLIPKDHGLFLANSLPIREFDLFASLEGSPVPIAANRGASGIDGTLASATGFAQGLKRPVTAVLGDLALLHDLNSLALARSSETPIIIIVFNNNGGGIFSFLPVAQFKEVFEKYFGTPHHLTFESAANLFGLGYEAPNSMEQFAEVYQKACQNKKTTLIEIKTDRQENYRLHQQLLRFSASKNI